MEEGTRTRELDLMLGDPRKAIRSMTVPLIVSFLIIQLNSFADQAWVSGLGADSLNAIASISPYYWVIAGVGAGIGVGTTVSIASRLAVGGNADRIPLQAVAVSILISLPMMVLITVSAGTMIDFMGVSSIRTECLGYLVPLTIMCLPIVLNGVMPGLMRGEGAARRSMQVSIITAVSNILLDPFFIYACGLGVSGAGWGTGVSAVFGIAYGTALYLTKRMQVKPLVRGFRPDGLIMKDILVVGIPKTAETLIISVLNMVQRFFLVGVGGVIAVSLYNIPWRYVALSNVLSMAIGAALVPVVAAAVSVKDTSKAKDALKYSFKLCMGYLLVLSVLIFVFADYLMTPFMTDPSLEVHRSDFVDVLHIYAFIIPMMAMIDIGSSVLQAMRKAHLSMVMSLVRNFIVIALFAAASRISLNAMFYSLLIAELIGGVSMMWLAVAEFRKLSRR